MPAQPWKRTWSPTPVVAMEERGGPGGTVYARWWQPRGVRGKWIRRSSGLRLRDAGDEGVSPEEERRALELGARMHAALRAGRDPAMELRAGRPLGEVLDLYLRTETPGLSGRHRRDLERAAGVIAEVLGAETQWSAITATSARTLWRAVAAGSAAGRGERWALRVAELLFRVGAWATLQGEVGSGFSAPAAWRRALAADWARIARKGQASPAVGRPRYSEDEAVRLWARLDDADPRLRLVVQVGAPGLRLVQVARVLRSDLRLALGVGEHGLGRLHVRGTRGKPGVTVDLDAAARRAVDDALTGLLAEREAAYRAGTIGDYALIPGGRLVGDCAPLGRDPLRPISVSTLRTLHRAWERSADVDPRGLRALRRLGADLAAGEAEAGTTPEAMDHLGGWAVGSRTRERVYRDAADLRARAEAERLRARIRARLRVPHACAQRAQGPALPRSG